MEQGRIKSRKLLWGEGDDDRIYDLKVLRIRKGNVDNERRPRVKLKLAGRSTSNLQVQRQKSHELEAKLSALGQTYDDNIFKLQQVRFYGNESSLIIYRLIFMSAAL